MGSTCKSFLQVGPFSFAWRWLSERNEYRARFFRRLSWPPKDLPVHRGHQPGEHCRNPEHAASSPVGEHAGGGLPVLVQAWVTAHCWPHKASQAGNQQSGRGEPRGGDRSVQKRLFPDETGILHCPPGRGKRQRAGRRPERNALPVREAERGQRDYRLVPHCRHWDAVCGALRRS